MRERHGPAAVLALLSTFFHASVHAIDGCPEKLDPVKYENGSVVYCNPDPEQYGPGHFFYQFPSCAPGQSCEYRWMGMYACCGQTVISQRSADLALHRASGQHRDVFALGLDYEEDSDDPPFGPAPPLPAPRRQQPLFAFSPLAAQF